MKTLITKFIKKLKQGYLYGFNKKLMLGTMVLGIFNIPIAMTQNSYCSGTKTYTAVQGIISDGSGQSSPYQGNSDCKFLIKPVGAISVSLYVNDFDTESNYDFVYIYY